MAFTPLHRELGVEPSDTTLDLIDLAIDRELEEKDDLDWKQVIPKPDQNEEFAKDVAAMANSGGGLIVFGVAEKPGNTSAAGGYVPINTWGDGEERRLRAVAYSHIQPPVHGIKFHTLTRDDASQVVLLDVPSSNDVPHLVWSGDRFTAPIRYGAKTEFMNERQIDAAYVARHSARDDLRTRIAQLGNEAVAAVRTEGQVWMTITAVPHRLRPAHLPRLTSEEFTDLVQRGSWRAPFIDSESGPDGIGGISPRPRYRRWVTVSEYSGVADHFVEVHDDGTVTQGIALRAVKDGEPVDIHPMLLQTTPAQALWLLRAVANNITIDSEYLVRIDLHSDNWPIYFRRYSRHSWLEDRGGPIVRFEPIEVTIDPHVSEESLHAEAWALVTDVINQGGITTPSTTYIKAPPKDA